MRQKLPKNTTFRLAFPILYGTAIYILVLLVFENFNSVFESFFNKEWLFTIFLTYFSSELLHLLSKLVASKFSFRDSIKPYIFAQLLLTMSAELLLVLISIHVYFIWVEGFSVYFTELVVFEMFFLFSVLLYNLFIFSYLLLHEENALQHELEVESMRKSEYMIQALQNDIEPEIFYSVMEALILYLRKNETISNEIISRLSELYRYRLENKQNELIKVKHEVLAAENLLHTLKHVYPDAIHFEVEDKAVYDQYLIVPVWLQRIILAILKSNILSPVEKFNIYIEYRDDALVIKHSKREKLQISEEKEIQKISSGIEFYTHSKIIIDFQSDFVYLKIPLLKSVLIDEEIAD